jgi:hypothetical protein
MLLVGVSACMTAAGCAAVPPAQIGQTAGTLAGGVIAPGIGAPIGALVGALAGMLVQGQVDKATETRERRELGDQLQAPSGGAGADAEAPRGVPVRVWVDESMKDGRRIAGHFDVRHLP